MANTHLLRSVQNMPVSIDRAWDFFSDPGNLLAMTPPSLNLKITNDLKGEKMYSGQIMTYTVKPLLRIPLFWMTEIRQVEPRKMSVDNQKKGPYALWHHEHHFREIEGGVEMTDLVTYKVPFGLLGDLAHPLVVKGQLRKIFTFRYHKIIELFGPWPGGGSLNLSIN